MHTWKGVDSPVFTTSTCRFPWGGGGGGGEYIAQFQSDRWEPRIQYIQASTSVCYIACVFLDYFEIHKHLFRHVMLPKEIAKLVPKTHLMSEAEWRSIGVQQSQGWIHYMIHEPGMLFGSYSI